MRPLNPLPWHRPFDIDSYRQVPCGCSRRQRHLAQLIQNGFENTFIDKPELSGRLQELHPRPPPASAHRQTPAKFPAEPLRPGLTKVSQRSRFMRLSKSNSYLSAGIFSLP